MVPQKNRAWFGKNGGAETTRFLLEAAILRRKTTALFGTMMSQVRVLSPRFLYSFLRLNPTSSPPHFLVRLLQVTLNIDAVATSILLMPSQPLQLLHSASLGRYILSPWYPREYIAANGNE